MRRKEEIERKKEKMYKMRQVIKVEKNATQKQNTEGNNKEKQQEKNKEEEMKKKETANPQNDEKK